MVSFTCNRCQDVVKKPKVLGHSNTCRSSSFTCVDCMNVFDLNSVKQHTSCITEVDKYQGRWRQKCSVNGNPPQMRNQHVDSDTEEQTLREPLRPPRPRMDNFSDSDSDDSDWVHAKKSNIVLATAEQTHSKSDHTAVKPKPKLLDNVVKRPRKENVSGTLGDNLSTAAHTRVKKTEDSDKLHPPNSNHTDRQKMVSLQLPPSNSATSTQCVVPAFVLGSAVEIAEIVSDILEEQPGRTCMRVKDVSKELVHRYITRISKSIQSALKTAIELGKVSLDEEGNIFLPQC